MRRLLCHGRNSGMRPERFECQTSQIIRLGRHPDSDLVFVDDQVSRRHAEISPRGDEWVLHNLSTTNPILVDGLQLTGEMVLGARHTLTLGTTSVLLEIETGPGGSSRTKAEALAGLVEYLDRLELITDAESMVELTLNVLHKHCRATWTGFLGNEAEELRVRAQYPENLAGNSFLSRELNRRVLTELKPVWQASVGTEGDISESLRRVHDSLGVPLIDSRAPQPRTLGVVHLYRQQDKFLERETHFAQIVAQMASHWLSNHRDRSALAAALERLRARSGVTDQLVGTSPAIKELKRKIEKVAVSGLAVLVRGESGTGKELIAAAIHRLGPRGLAPLIAVNCASIDHMRAESDLFGHEKGAFTGADSRHAGYFQQAHEGTLFLDEVGELPLDCQAKLLRALESGVIRPMKGRELRVDVRLIAATNRNLEVEIAAGRFREDLYYRIAPVVIEAPLLRNRVGDIRLLAQHFLDRLALSCHRVVRLSPRALLALEAYSWPGNVRQLRSVIEAGFHLADGDEIVPEHLPMATNTVRSSDDSLNLEEAEKRMMTLALERTGNNLSRAAELLGIHRETLGIRARKLGLLPRA
jgi:DNA-binding NtrC family response regulator